MEEIEQIPAVERPLWREMVIVWFVCPLVLTFTYLAAYPWVSKLQDWSAECLIYAILPIAVTFFLLYRSGWHREITGFARTCSVFLLSCVILAGDLIAVVVVFCMAVFFFCLIAFIVNAFVGGNHW